MNRKLLGSAFASLCGWVSGWLCLFATYYLGQEQYKFTHVWQAVLGDLGGFVWMGFFIVPTWLLLVAPLYLTVPRRSLFWKSYVCIPFGAIVAVCILLSPVAYSELVIYHANLWDVIITWSLSLPAAIVGAVTAWIGTTTYDYFAQNTFSSPAP